MAQMNYEKENDGLDQLMDRQSIFKVQTNTEMSQIAQKVLKTPMTKGLSGFQTPLDKCSRKAFGNVSNVLRSEPIQPIRAKPQLKASDQLNNGLKSELKKATTAEVGTDCKSNPFLDEIEDMYPIEEELMSDMNDSITADLFAIDDRIVFGMPFDSDLTECLLNKQSLDFNHFL